MLLPRSWVGELPCAVAAPHPAIAELMGLVRARFAPRPGAALSLQPLPLLLLLQHSMKSASPAVGAAHGLPLALPPPPSLASASAELPRRPA
jgi:hypothetical protein